jgi:hypothetical protein
MPLWQNKEENLITNPMAIEAAFQTCGFRDIHFESKMALPDAVDEIIIIKNALSAFFCHQSPVSSHK